MAFETLGMNLVVQGVNTFVSDMNRVNTSLMRYVSSMRSYESQLLKVAQNEQKIASQRIYAATRWSQQVNEDIYLAEQLIMQYQAIGQAVPTVLTQQYTNLLVEQGKAQSELQLSINDGVEANKKYNDIANRSTNIVDMLVETLGFLTKGFGNNVIQGTALGKMFMKLVPGVSGLTLVLDVMKIGFDASVFAIRAFNTILGTVWNIVRKAINILVELGKTLVGYVWQGVKTVGNALLNLAATPFNWIIRGLENIWRAIGNIIQITIGMSFDRILWGIGQRFREIAEEAYNAGVEFQLVQIRLRGLIQREMVETSAIPFSESLVEATARAKELSYWISELGVRSIFSTTAIQDIVTLGMAYDYTEEETKTLTMATVNFATAMGLDNLAMVRIIENMGQMKAAGKMTGTELRDLARGSFVPVNRVFQVMAKMPSAIDEIRKVTGKTITDWMTLKGMGAKGDIPVELFMKAFIEMVNQDFPNAIESAQTSMQVLQSNIKDFIESFVGWRVFTPILDEIAGRANKIMNILISDETRTRFEVIGASFTTIFTRILDFFDKKGPNIESVITNILNGLMTISQIAAEVISGNFYSAYQILSGKEAWWLPDISERIWTPPTVPNQYFEDLKKAVDKSNPYYWLVDPGTFTETSNKAQMLSDNVRSSIYAVVKFVEDHQKDIQAFFEDPLGWIKENGIPIIQDLATKGFEFLRTKASEALEYIKGWFADQGPVIVDWINTKFQGALDGIMKFVSTNFGADNPLYNFLQLVKDIVNYIATLAGGATTTQEVWAGGFIVATWEKSDVSGALDKVTTSFNNLKESVRALMDEQLRNLGDWIATNLPGFEGFKKIWEDLKDAFKIIEPAFKNISDTLGTTMKGGDLKGFVDDFVKFVEVLLHPEIDKAALSIRQFLDVVTVFLGVVKGIGSVFSQFVQDWKEFWNIHSTIPQPSQVPWSNSINPNSALQITILSPDDVDAQMKKAMDGVPMYFDVNDPMSPANTAKSNAEHFTGVITDTFDQMKEDLVTHSIVPEMMDEIYNVMVRTMDEINIVLPGQVNLMVKEIQRAIDKVKELVDELKKVNVNVNVSGGGGGGGGTGGGAGGNKYYQSGGSFVIPPGFENEKWPLGGNQYASSGEMVAIIPRSLTDSLNKMIYSAKNSVSGWMTWGERKNFNPLAEERRIIPTDILPEWLGKRQTPNLITSFPNTGSRSYTTNNTRNNNYNLAVSTTAPVQSIISQYEIIKALM